MTTLAPPSLVDGASRVPLPFGLFSVASPREDSNDRWEAGGVTWERVTCEDLGTLGPPQRDNADVAGMPKDLDRQDAEPGGAASFSVYGHFTCTPVGIDQAEALDRAKEQLRTQEEASVERILWTGARGVVPNFAGENDYDSPEDLGSHYPIPGMARLEQYLAEEYGSQGVIHMSRRNALLLFTEGMLAQRGGKLRTPLDTPVVAGAGYGSDKIVGSPALFGYRSSIFPGPDAVSMDTRRNNLTAIAERSYVIGFDPCGLASFTMKEPAYGGGGSTTAYPSSATYPGDSTYPADDE